MKNKRIAAIAGAGIAALAIIGVVLAVSLSGSGTKTPSHHHAKAAPVAATSFTAADAQLTCSKLTASPLPIAAYDQRVIDEINAMAGNGNASNAEVKRAHAIVNAEIRARCPHFANLIKQEG